MQGPTTERSGMTSWGAVAWCFSTVCVCATAIIITNMILSQEGEATPQPAPAVAQAPLTAAPQPPPPPAPVAKAPAAPVPAAPPPAAPSPQAAAAPVKVEGNLVRNGDFETLGGEGASLFEDWGYWGRWEKGEYRLETAPGHTGKYSAKMACAKPGRGGISQQLQGVKPGDKLQITFWAKADKAVGGRLFLNLEGTPGDGWSSMDIKPGTYDWQEFTKVVTCPASTSPDYKIMIFFYNKSQGDVAFDDIAAVKLAP